MVLVRLKETLTFVCLNRLVIFIIKGVEKVKTDHLVGAGFSGMGEGVLGVIRV
jgi:hypothetical protein